MLWAVLTAKFYTFLWLHPPAGSAIIKSFLGGLCPLRDPPPPVGSVGRGRLPTSSPRPSAPPAFNKNGRVGGGGTFGSGGGENNLNVLKRIMISMLIMVTMLIMLTNSKYAFIWVPFNCSFFCEIGLGRNGVPHPQLARSGASVVVSFRSILIPWAQAKLIFDAN